MTQNGVSFDSAFDDQDKNIERQGSRSIKPSQGSPGDSIPNQIPRGHGNERRSAN